MNKRALAKIGVDCLAMVGEEAIKQGFKLTRGKNERRN